MPKIKGNLQRHGREKIRKNYTYLLDEIDGRELVDYLFQEDVFELDDLQEIGKKRSRRKRTSLFLTKILNSGPYGAYDKFLETLKKHYPHCAERLENTAHEGEEKILEKGHSPKKSEEKEQSPTVNIHSHECLQKTYCLFTNLCSIRHHRDSLVPTSTFNIKHLPLGFQHNELLNCIKSLAEQTVMVMAARPVGSGRIWRVNKKFSKVDEKTCPCTDCKLSATPKKHWGEFIVLTTNMFNDAGDCRLLRFLVGDDSNESPLMLKGVSLISNDDTHDFSEVMCITHDAHVSRYVEKVIRRNSSYREKLLDRSHFLPSGKKLAVLISYPHEGQKLISVGDWLQDGGSSGHVYSAAGCSYSRGGPVLLAENGRACVTLHSGWDWKKRHCLSSGRVWSL